ncbi:VOC family protein [Nocardia sp. alder85J]|uniref:VOC family protein n=1 Tax=Nocardia sp. alder85J TaxID=2862949 RepID=UPI001CD69998|nr:VOC family protein [Nocardia sp. alder85J]MCX4090727.1 VOC family protein [Nocardia sp. alder85J]
MKADDQFHLGIVTTDFDATVAALTATLGYEWGIRMTNPVDVELPTGPRQVELTCQFSIQQPRLEIVSSVAGTLWEPVPGGGIHHLGYWADDVAADVAELTRNGWEVEATRPMPGTDPADGVLFFAFLSSARGFRIELVDRRVEPGMRQCWAAVV